MKVPSRAGKDAQTLRASESASARSNLAHGRKASEIHYILQSDSPEKPGQMNQFNN
jgi:hypothetical protein